MGKPKERGLHPVRDFFGGLFEAMGCVGEGCLAFTVLIALAAPATLLLLR
ncbi:hypothetical protein [Sphingomonas jatrophae]|nr:hypothetical protein [Sphingomonas jatrophae]